jgi:hypothetical protein
VNPDPVSRARRTFLRALASGATGLLVRGSSTGHAQSDTPAFVAVSHDGTGRQIAADFIGLSYESAVLADDEFNPSNSSLLGLIRSLGLILDHPAPGAAHGCKHRH